MLQLLCFVNDKSMLKRRLEIDSAKLEQYSVIEFASMPCLCHLRFLPAYFEREQTLREVTKFYELITRRILIAREQIN